MNENEENEENQENQENQENTGTGIKILGVMFILLAGLSGYSVYSIFNDFTGGDKDTGGNSKADLEQLSVFISAFYILILLTCLILAYLSFKEGDPHHIPCLIFSSFLFFYGFTSLIPAAIAAEDGATNSIYGPIATSGLSVLIGGGMVVYYLIKGTPHLTGSTR